MTEEIKEMLHCIEMNCKHNKCFGGVKLDEEDCKLLLDYITNLQQENEAKTHQIEVLEEIVNYERNIRNDKLQQENKYLEHIINNLKDNNNRLEEIIHDTDIVLEQENERLKEELEDYKSRCKKTIEYIDEHTLFVNGGIIKNILNGSDEK